jgi:hypothetical protein
MPTAITFGSIAARAFGFLGRVLRKDEYFKYVTLLLPGNGTNGAQNNTFLDSSTNNFTITRNGVATQGTFTPYGSNWSNYFDGNGDYLSAANNTALNPESGNFTIETWVQLAAPVSGGDWQIVAKGSSNFVLDVNVLSGKFTFAQYGVAVLLTSATVLRVGTWYHVAVCRSGTSLKMYVNGVEEASTTNSANFTSSAALEIGRDPVGATARFNGYISNLRLVKGTAVYTSNFTPSTSPLTAITNTSLLTCQSNRFVDNSTNAFTITRNGDVSVQRFSPFSPTAPYAAGTDGGSGYFDAASWLDTPSSSTAFVFGTGDYTIEGFAYRDGAGTSEAGIFAITGIRIARFSGNLRFTQGVASDGSGGTSVSETLPPPGQWFHWAAVRSSGTMRLYINGVSNNTASSSTNFTGSRSATIGRALTTQLANFWTGWISSVRVTSGSALYTSNFTPPTSPPTTTVSGGTVQLLTNFTNAGILDNAEMSTLETVGNAQISTAQSKFGGGSMYFDGTGDQLSSPTSVNNNLGTGDFTVECWVYANSFSSSPCIVDARPSGTGVPWAFYINTSGQPYFYDGSVRASTVAVSATTWTHIAATRSSGTLRIFVNGTQGYSASVTGDLSAGGLQIGGAWGGSYLNGYIDDLRITKGYARYTANFTAPTAPFPLS